MIGDPNGVQADQHPGQALAEPDDAPVAVPGQRVLGVLGRPDHEPMSGQRMSTESRVSEPTPML